MSERRGTAQRGEGVTNRAVVADDVRHTKAAQLFLEEEVLGGEAALGEGAADDEAEVIGVDWLGEEIEGAFSHRPYDVRDRPVGRQEDDRHLRIAGLGGAAAPRTHRPAAASNR